MSSAPGSPFFHITTAIRHTQYFVADNIPTSSRQTYAGTKDRLIPLTFKHSVCSRTVVRFSDWSFCPRETLLPS